MTLEKYIRKHYLTDAKLCNAVAELQVFADQLRDAGMAMQVAMMSGDIEKMKESSRAWTRTVTGAKYVGEASSRPAPEGRETKKS